MKKYILFISLFAGMALSSAAQSTSACCSAPKNTCTAATLRSKTRTRGMAVSEIEASLSEESQKKFQTLHEAYLKEMAAIREKYSCERPQKGDKPSEEKQDKCIKNRFAVQKAVNEVQSNYYTKFREILSPCQTAQVLGLNNTPANPGASSRQHGKKQQGKNRNYQGNRQACQDK